MLRLTEESRTPSEVCIRAEGQLVSEWADFFERELLAREREGPLVSVDLTGVYVIDERAVGILRRLLSDRIRISRCPPLIQELLEWDGPHDSQTPAE